MAIAVRPRLLLAVSPPLLADVLARVLAADGAFDVVVAVDGQRAEHQHAVQVETAAYDVGLVTSGLPPGVRASTVIQLPATASGAGVGRVRTRLSEREVLILGITSIRQLIDELRGGHADVVSD